MEGLECGNQVWGGWRWWEDGAAGLEVVSGVALAGAIQWRSSIEVAMTVNLMEDSDHILPCWRLERPPKLAERSCVFLAVAPPAPQPMPPPPGVLP